MAARMRPPVRRAYWQAQELEILLEALMPEQAARIVMASSSKPNKAFFMDAARALRRRGFQRTFLQCRSKFKDLKGRFFETLEDFGPHPPVRKRPPYFEQLRELWIRGDRPRWEDRRPQGMQPRRGRRVPEQAQQPGRGSPAAAPQGEARDLPEDADQPGPSGAAPPPREPAPLAAAAPPSPDAAAADEGQPGPSRRLRRRRRLERGPEAEGPQPREVPEVQRRGEGEPLLHRRVAALEAGQERIMQLLHNILQVLPGAAPPPAQ